MASSGKKLEYGKPSAAQAQQVMTNHAEVLQEHDLLTRSIQPVYSSMVEKLSAYKSDFPYFSKLLDFAATVNTEIGDLQRYLISNATAQNDIRYTKILIQEIKDKITLFSLKNSAQLIKLKPSEQNAPIRELLILTNGFGKVANEYLDMTYELATKIALTPKDDTPAAPGAPAKKKKSKKKKKKKKPTAAATTEKDTSPSEEVDDSQSSDDESQPAPSMGAAKETQTAPTTASEKTTEEKLDAASSNAASTNGSSSAAGSTSGAGAGSAAGSTSGAGAGSAAGASSASNSSAAAATTAPKAQPGRQLTKTEQEQIKLFSELTDHNKLFQNLPQAIILFDSISYPAFTIQKINGETRYFCKGPTKKFFESLELIQGGRVGPELKKTLIRDAVGAAGELMAALDMHARSKGKETIFLSEQIEWTEFDIVTVENTKNNPKVALYECKYMQTEKWLSFSPTKPEEKKEGVKNPIKQFEKQKAIADEYKYDYTVVSSHDIGDEWEDAFKKREINFYSLSPKKTKSSQTERGEELEKIKIDYFHSFFKANFQAAAETQKLTEQAGAGAGAGAGTKTPPFQPQNGH